jgi:hypothetical protein
MQPARSHGKCTVYILQPIVAVTSCETATCVGTGHICFSHLLHWHLKLQRTFRTCTALHCTALKGDVFLGCLSLLLCFVLSTMLP